jgi:FXSXX-COOH protein
MYHFRSISAGKVRRVGYNLADHVGGGGVTNIGGGAQLPMSTLQVDPVITSDLTDLHDLSLDVEVNLDDGEYARIMRRIGLGDGEPGTTVSAFNSSI